MTTVRTHKSLMIMLFTPRQLTSKPSAWLGWAKRSLPKSWNSRPLYQGMISIDFMTDMHWLKFSSKWGKLNLVWCTPCTNVDHVCIWEAIRKIHCPYFFSIFLGLLESFCLFFWKSILLLRNLISNRSRTLIFVTLFWVIGSVLRSFSVAIKKPFFLTVSYHVIQWQNYEAYFFFIYFMQIIHAQSKI